LESVLCEYVSYSHLWLYSKEIDGPQSFADRDMFARFAGIGVGHDAVNLGQVPALSTAEDNEVDVEACRESEEPDTVDEDRERSDSEAGCSDDENDDTGEDLDPGNACDDSEGDEDDSYY